jgi:hypothetical protein
VDDQDALPRRGDGLQFVAEVFGTTKEIADSRGDIQARVGLRYTAIEDLGLDAAIGRSFTSHPEVEFSLLSASPGPLMHPGNAAIDKHLKEKSDASSEALVSRVD